MRKVLTKLLTFLALTLGAPSFLSAAELVMIDARACTYCARFRAEVAPIYDTTAAGQIAPLRPVSPLKAWPEDLAGVRPARFAPVFILVENGSEVGRFAGYTNRKHFWEQLWPLIVRLQQSEALFIY